MAEPTVQVPVSLLRRLLVNDDERDAGEAERELTVLLSQPTPTAEPVTNEQAWAEGFEAGATWPQHTASGVPIDPPMNPYESTAKPPRIEDMAPGTLFEYPTRWEVSGRGGMTGRVIVEMVEERTTRYLDDLDPSTIRDVREPEQ